MAKAEKGKFLTPKDHMGFECEIFVLCHVFFFSFPFLSFKKIIEYDFEWLSVEDESVHQNNASMIEMLTLTKPTKFSTGSMDHFVHVCVGLPSYLTVKICFVF